MANVQPEYNAKRFAYDVLFKVLSKYLPGTLLQVEIDEINKYPNPETDVLIVSAGVIYTALNSRDKWKHFFKSRQEILVLNDMQKLEDFLEKSAFFPKTTDLAPDIRIRRSLAFFSELVLFLHSNSIEVDLDKLLDVWSKYFHEKIALHADPNAMLHKLFFEDEFIENYLDVVDDFIEEVAKPYGEKDDVSRLFLIFTKVLEGFIPKLPLSNAEKSDIINDILNNWYSHKIPEESVWHLSKILHMDSGRPGHSQSLEQSQHQHGSSFPSTSAEGVQEELPGHSHSLEQSQHQHGSSFPSTSAEGVQETLEEENLEEEETSPESEGKTSKDEQ